MSAATSVTLEPQWTYKTSDQIQAVAVSTNASVIAAGGDGNRLYVLDNSGNLLWVRNLESPILYVATAFDGSSITAVNDRGKIYCFNQSGSEKWNYQTNIGSLSGKTTSFAQTSDASFTVLGNEYGKLYKINKTGNLALETFLGRKIFDIAITSDGAWILTGESSGNIDLLDNGGNITWNTTGFADHVAISRDGGVFVIGGGEASLGEFSHYLYENLTTYQKMGTVNDIAITPRGTASLVASEDGTLYRYDREGRSVWNYSFNGKAMQKVSIPSDASRIAAIADDNKVILIKNDGSLVGVSVIPSPALDISFAPDGGSFAAASRDQNIYFFRVPYATASVSPAITKSPTAESVITSPPVSVTVTLPNPSGISTSTSTATTPKAGSVIVPFVLVLALLCACVLHKNT